MNENHFIFNFFLINFSDDRQMDYAEQLESVAYVICGENSKITFKNFGEIWQARGVSNHKSLNNILRIKIHATVQCKQTFVISFF